MTSAPTFTPHIPSAVPPTEPPIERPVIERPVKRPAVVEKPVKRRALTNAEERFLKGAPASVLAEDEATFQEAESTDDREQREAKERWDNFAKSIPEQDRRPRLKTGELIGVGDRVSFEHMPGKIIHGTVDHVTERGAVGGTWVDGLRFFTEAVRPFMRGEPNWDAELAAVAPGWVWCETGFRQSFARWIVNETGGPGLVSFDLVEGIGEVEGIRRAPAAVLDLVTRRNADEVRERAAADRPVRLRDFGAVDDTEALQAALDFVNAAAPYNVNGVVGVTRAYGLTSYYAEPPVRDWDAELLAIAPEMKWNDGDEDCGGSIFERWWVGDDGCPGFAVLWETGNPCAAYPNGQTACAVPLSGGKHPRFDALARLVAERNGVTDTASLWQSKSDSIDRTQPPPGWGANAGVAARGWEAFREGMEMYHDAARREADADVDRDWDAELRALDSKLTWYSSANRQINLLCGAMDSLYPWWAGDDDGHGVFVSRYNNLALAIGQSGHVVESDPRIGRLVAERNGLTLPVVEGAAEITPAKSKPPWSLLTIAAVKFWGVQNFERMTVAWQQRCAHRMDANEHGPYCCVCKHVPKETS